MPLTLTKLCCAGRSEVELGVSHRYSTPNVSAAASSLARLLRQMWRAPAGGAV